MALHRQLKNLRGRYDDDYVKAHYTVPYSTTNNSRYKHIDELLLKDGKTVKATLGTTDLSVYPFSGMSMYVVPDGEEDRIDIIASKTLGSASLYWAICYMNNIDDPLSIKVGRTLYIPSLSSLRQFPNPLS